MSNWVANPKQLPNHYLLSGRAKIIAGIFDYLTKGEKTVKDAIRR